jgi:hypothetical protein
VLKHNIFFPSCIVKMFKGRWGDEWDKYCTWERLETRQLHREKYFEGADNDPATEVNIRFYGPEDVCDARTACHSWQLSPVYRQKFNVQ